MASINWPEDLPITLKIGGLSASYNDPVIRTDMDAGPQKARQRYTGASKNFTGTMIVPEAKRAAFEYFYVVTTRFGVLRFNLVNPQTLAVEEFRFKGSYREDGTDDGLFSISMNLERMA